MAEQSPLTSQLVAAGSSLLRLNGKRLSFRGRRVRTLARSAATLRRTSKTSRHGATSAPGPWRPRTSSRNRATTRSVVSCGRWVSIMPRFPPVAGGQAW